MRDKLSFTVLKSIIRNASSRLKFLNIFALIWFDVDQSSSGLVYTPPEEKEKNIFDFLNVCFFFSSYFYSTGYFKMMWYVTTRVVMLPLPFWMIDCLDDVFCLWWKMDECNNVSHFTHKGNIKPPPQAFTWHLWSSIMRGVEKLKLSTRSMACICTLWESSL